MRVVFGWANSRNNNHATKVIGGLAVGRTLGDSATHEINAEWLVSAWQTRFYDINGNLMSKFSEMHAPFLVNYRYYIPMPRVPWAFHLGSGLGVDLISRSYTPPEQEEIWSKESTWQGGWSFSVAAAANAGLVVRCSQYFSLDVSYRCMWQSASGYCRNNATNATNGQPAPKPTVYVGTRPDIVNMVTFAARFWY